MSATSFLCGKVTLYAGDSRDVLATMADCSIDSVVCDPPYALVSIGKRYGAEGAAAAQVGATGAYARASAGFMGQQWDTGETAFAVEFWAQVLRVLKPGGHVVSFGGTRSHHRMWCAIEDAGFEIRDSLLYLFDLDPIVEAFFASLDPVQQQSFLYIIDQCGPGGMLAWIYGSGFPKSHDTGKAFDKSLYGRFVDEDGGEPMPQSHAGAYWQGWGTALKPAWEPIVLARKPLDGTVAANVLMHRTGALNVDGCRVGTATVKFERAPGNVSREQYRKGTTVGPKIPVDHGRWPANIVHDGSDEVVAAFPDVGKSTGGQASLGAFRDGDVFGKGRNEVEKRDPGFGDAGSAARFFYSAKADADDRIGSKHPTVKPVDLMQWLCRLVTPPGGTVLDPFAGTGTTGEAAFREGFRAILIEREAEYQADIARRMALCMAGPDERTRESIKAKTKGKPVDHGPLFGGAP